MPTFMPSASTSGELHPSDHSVSTSSVLHSGCRVAIHLMAVNQRDFLFLHQRTERRNYCEPSCTPMSLSAVCVATSDAGGGVTGKQLTKPAPSRCPAASLASAHTGRRFPNDGR